MSGSQQLILAEGAGGAAPVYIEDVFSTWLYTGTGSARSISSGIDLSTYGGLVWVKDRTQSSTFNVLVDTARGASRPIYSNSNLPQQNASSQNINGFNSNGFSLGTDLFGNVNTNGDNFASWTFRKQPKYLLS